MDVAHVVDRAVVQEELPVLFGVNLGRTLWVDQSFGASCMDHRFAMCSFRSIPNVRPHVRICSQVSSSTKMPSASRCFLTFASISPGRRMPSNPAAGGEDLTCSMKDCVSNKEVSMTCELCGGKIEEKKIVYSTFYSDMKMSSGSGLRDSGLWHQRHPSGHPVTRDI